MVPRSSRQRADPASRRQSTESASPCHVELQNLVARAAGFRKLQALKSARPEPIRERATLAFTDNAGRALMQFDADDRLVRWPAKFTIQRMAMWVLWTRFEAKRLYPERHVDTAGSASAAA